MMNFSHTYIDAPLYAKDDVVWHYYDPVVPSRYGSNFMIFKQMPSLSTFQQYEARQHDFHQHHDMSHLRFLFPEGETFSKELQTYLENRAYTIGTLELYAILPIEFQGRKNDDVTVKIVDESLIAPFLAVQYEMDLVHGEAFATEKQTFLKQQFTDSCVQFIVGMIDDTIVGVMTLFIADDTVELDSFEVKEQYQRRGIGSTMQHVVMELYTDRMILLVADGEDTAREMYQRQGYHFCSARYEILLTK